VLWDLPYCWCSLVANFGLSSCSCWFLIPIQLRRFSSQEMKVFFVQRKKRR
jgi:hypothetical protein